MLLHGWQYLSDHRQVDRPARSRPCRCRVTLLLVFQVNIARFVTPLRIARFSRVGKLHSTLVLSNPRLRMPANNRVPSFWHGAEIFRDNSPPTIPSISQLINQARRFHGALSGRFIATAIHKAGNRVALLVVARPRFVDELAERMKR